MAKRSNRTAAAALLIAAMALVCAAPAPAEASARLCRDLEAQLSAIGVARASAPQARRYERAIGDQRAQMEKVQSQQRRAGCAGFGIGRVAGDACQSLAQSLQRMQANLQALEAQHRRLTSARAPDPRRERQRLVAALDANGCRDDARVARRPERPDRRQFALTEQLFGGTVVPPRHAPLEIEPRDHASNRPSGIIHIRPRYTGSFRTLCVRTCDGYFFPISYSASGADIDRDAESCASMCPGTEVELYMHRTPTEEAEQMVSRGGIPYTQLPTAFRYRQSGFVRPEGCGCNPVRQFTLLGGGAVETETEEPPPSAEPVIPVPVFRPDPAADPETLANREGGLDLASVKRLFAVRRSMPAPGPGDEDGERRIRVVGPAFLPDPEAAIDLTAPGQNPVP